MRDTAVPLRRESIATRASDLPSASAVAIRNPRTSSIREYASHGDEVDAGIEPYVALGVP
jgi:hypothetical protein